MQIMFTEEPKVCYDYFSFFTQVSIFPVVSKNLSFCHLALTEFHILLILFRSSIMLCIFLNFLSTSPSLIKPLSLDCLFSRFSSCCWNLPPGFLVIILDFFTHTPEAHTSVGPWSVTVGPSVYLRHWISLF